MAFFQVNFFSPTLRFGTDVNVVIPTPNADELMNHKDTSYFHTGAKYQVLYLLHGAYGDYSDWMRLTSIEKYAQNHKIAVVMPSASNSFYQDMYRGSQYLTYLTEELPEFIESLFPVSRKRENTFVAGLSMGGYGAWRLALQKPEQYACAASLSGAVDILGTVEAAKRGEIGGPFKWEALFEHPDAIEGSDADLFALAAKRKAEGRPLPKLFQCVGTEDFTYNINQNARKRMTELGLDLTYAEHPGIHDWDYWDAHIQDVLNWLPLAESTVAE